jgi:hypothetical protein
MGLGALMGTIAAASHRSIGIASNAVGYASAAITGKAVPVLFALHICLGRR